jgi:hypothetical protein
MSLRRIFSVTLLLAALLRVPVLCRAQDAPGKPAGTQITLRGIVAEKGVVLHAETDQKIYRVLNSETLKHLEGQLVTLRARYLGEQGQLYVIAVRAEAAPIPNTTFHLDDAAFRR